MAMSDEHKAALAVGRRESRTIKSYLDAMGSRKPGRPVTAESLRQKIQRLQGRLEEEPDTLKRVDLMQKRLDAEDALATSGGGVDIAELEAEFVVAVGGYSARKGIGYSAWREAGVPADVLKKAGIARTRRG